MVEESIWRSELHEAIRDFKDSKAIKNEDEVKMRNQYGNQQQQEQDTKIKIKKGMKIKLDCEFCKGPITGYPRVFRFANYERFFCCNGCMSGYKQKIFWKNRVYKKKV
jgi:Lrp/AsnC family leucine-responsive transcriptional regulator